MVQYYDAMRSRMFSSLTPTSYARSLFFNAYLLSHFNAARIIRKLQDCLIKMSQTKIAFPYDCELRLLNPKGFMTGGLLYSPLEDCPK